MEDIIKKDTKDVPRIPSGKPLSGKKREDFIEIINELNVKIVSLLSQIENNANTFLKDHFCNGEELIKIGIRFDKKFHFDLIEK